MIVGRWLLVETLGRPETWSVLAAATVPRNWKSLQRAVPARLQPIIASAYTGGAPIDLKLPPSRHPWSGLHAVAEPVHGPDARVYAVNMWVGEGDPPERPAAATFQVNARTRQVEARAAGLGPNFDNTRTHWTGAEAFELIERFDGALELLATMARSAPDSRWLGTATVRSATGPRSLLLATRNANTVAARHDWFGLAIDVTESVVPQGKSFEASTLEILRDTRPNLHLAIFDLTHIRLIRWLSAPAPGLPWGSGVDERTIPHPDDRPRILAIRNKIRAGAPRQTLTAVRFATTTNTWLTADLDVSPLPGPTPPDFALVQLQVTNPS